MPAVVRIGLIAALTATFAVVPVAGSLEPPELEPPSESCQVARVVDGDTIEVRINGHLDKVRLIGVDTPESVHPFKPVEYFAKEASEFTRSLVEGKVVRLQGEPGTANRDRYDRLLRYVYLEDGRLLNAEIIAQGYGFAYVKYPFGKIAEFRALERTAREKGLGLWADRTAAASTTSEPRKVELW